jgi:hypothetical protein
VPGYYDFLHVISNPDHEEHEEILEWCGGSFNPHFFDINATNTVLKHIKLQLSIGHTSNAYGNSDYRYPFSLYQATVLRMPSSRSTAGS